MTEAHDASNANIQNETEKSFETLMAQLMLKWMWKYAKAKEFLWPD